MKLYIDGKLASLKDKFDVNLTYRFLDTYNPSAIKTAYSKTVSLPDCPENAAIFGLFKAKYDFELFEDSGKLLEKGYCVLDKIKSIGIVKTYEITLYGGLGDFFYNLKGDEDNPKSLADLYWGNITGKDQVRENLDPLMNWNNRYVYNTWFNASMDKIHDTFRAVPCIYDDGIMKKDLTIVPPGNGIFPETGSHSEDQEAPLPFVGSDGTEALLVQSEENTCYGKQDFRSDLMPLGIKYRSIIETICQPENNGGYTVELDPNFFNETNPYWTQMFLLKGLPTLDYDYTVTSSNFEGFSWSLIKIGNYQAGSATSQSTVLAPTGDSDLWIRTDSNRGIELRPGIVLADNVVNYNIVTYINAQENLQGVSYSQMSSAWLKSRGDLVAMLTVTNLDTNETRTLATETYPKGSKFYPFGSTVTGRFKVGNLRGAANIPLNWTRLKFTVTLSYPKRTSNFELRYYLYGGGTIGVGFLNIKGDYCGPAYRQLHSDLEDSRLQITPTYVQNAATFGDLNFLKKDLLGGTKSPFEYLIWYTKMFNLRFYLEPGSKKVSIYLPEDMIQQYDPVNIQDRVCYDKEYSKTRRIIDEGYLKFNLNPNKNETVDKYVELNGEDIFDRTYAIKTVEGKNQKEYLSSELKVGSMARHTGDWSRRTGSYDRISNYYGFNQVSPFQVTYISGSGAEETRPADDVSLNYREGVSRYDFLTIGDGLADTVVLYGGLKSTPVPRGDRTNHAGIISRTSVDMVRLAGGPCWISGFPDRSPGIQGHLIGADFIFIYEYPSYGLVPSVDNSDWGLTYSNIDFESLVATGNIYDKFLKTFIERVYSDPVQVECYVRLSSPDFRKLYWFDNAYWILTEVSNYNFRDEPVKCKFIRYDNA